MFASDHVTSRYLYFFIPSPTSPAAGYKAMGTSVYFATEASARPSCPFGNVDLVLKLTSAASWPHTHHSGKGNSFANCYHTSEHLL
jgi:hypothetical protein